jgi:hypothetical protein
VLVKIFISIYALFVIGAIALAPSLSKPYGEGSVTFESAGGKWQKALITDQLTGEISSAYSLDAEESPTDLIAARHPRIAFSCRKQGKFDGVQFLTGTVVANQSVNVTGASSGWARVSTRSDGQAIQTWSAQIANNGSDLLADQGIISNLLNHKRLSIRFASASGGTITDEYATEGLSTESLKADCPALFEKK